jgi:hypothetical protein
MKIQKQRQIDLPESADGSVATLTFWLKENVISRKVTYLLPATPDLPMTLFLEGGLSLYIDYFVQPCGESDVVWYLQLHPDLLLDLLRPMVLCEIACVSDSLIKAKFCSQSSWVVGKLNLEHTAKTLLSNQMGYVIK